MNKSEMQDRIIEVLQDIFSQGTFVVETYNEGLLVELMAMNGTAIKNYENPRVDYNHVVELDDFNWSKCDVCGRDKSCITITNNKMQYTCEYKCKNTTL